MCDLLKTIDDDEEVENFSEDSDIEIDFQPKTVKKQRQEKLQRQEFDTNFSFDVATVQNSESQNDNFLSKLTKRNINQTKIQKKIDEFLHNKKKNKINNNNEGKEKDGNDGEDDENEKEEEVEEEDEDDEDYLSEDDYQPDKLKTKTKNVKSKKHDNTTITHLKKEEDGNEDEITSFNQLNLSRPLIKKLTEMNIIHPTHIQQLTIPEILAGNDVIASASTGTGKTLSFLLPVCERLFYKTDDGAKTRVLILVPTRELGVQIYETGTKITEGRISFGLSVGGLEVKIQESVLRKSPDVVVATPGRLIDHLHNAPNFSLKHVEILILDEADRLLDQNFSQQFDEILRHCAPSRQTLLFTATLTDNVQSIVEKMRRPKTIDTVSVLNNLRHEFVRIRDENDRMSVLFALVLRTFTEKCIVFTNTKNEAHELYLSLKVLGLKVGELHGNMTQLQRLNSLHSFKTNVCNFLVCTDVGSRGLDIANVQTVINLTMPNNLESYQHRVGRTARAGKCGVAVSLVGEKDRNLTKRIVKIVSKGVKCRKIVDSVMAKMRQETARVAAEVKILVEMEKVEREAEKLLKKQQQNEKEKKEGPKEKRNFMAKPNEKSKEKMNVKKKKRKEKTDEDSRLQRTAFIQSKIAKRKGKQGKIRTVEETKSQTTSGKKRKSNFGDLTNVSQKQVKKLRYEAGKKRMEGKRGKKSKK
ncbi:probable ATP-dependent RNA helicase DDX27 [Aethina tumida]|uniref:probable ATP-dependent RNA helicase DDX27 n=1 Tax=Aethina tumida TaxID=116153 RepID=UPI0021496D6C|nr:probable ATP-dependent RNA helicase DDX27 [Aethina tumida]